MNDSKETQRLLKEQIKWQKKSAQRRGFLARLMLPNFIYLPIKGVLGLPARIIRMVRGR